MKLAINILLSLVMLAVCAWLVWPTPENKDKLAAAFEALELRTFWPYLAGYLGLLASTHFFRAWRWNNLLRPIGISLPAGKLLAISSVGFMAILALPARLGEFVRPALLRKKGEVSGSSVLGTVAVERIVDGLMVSLFFAACSIPLLSQDPPGWLLPAVAFSLGGFLMAMLFLIFALKSPDRTIHFAVTMTGTRKLAPRLAERITELLANLIQGFRVLGDRQNLAMFVFWSALYWICNGAGMWVLARGFGLDLPVIGAYATMCIVAVGITLPNAPALAGQYHALVVGGLSLYVTMNVAETVGLAYALVLHGIQVVWYVGMGGLAMLSSHVRFSEVVASTRETAEEVVEARPSP